MTVESKCFSKHVEKYARRIYDCYIGEVTEDFGAAIIPVRDV